MNVIEKLNARELRNDLPELGIGDTVKVHVKVREGDKERVQIFEGMIIALKHGGPSATMTVRKTSFGQGVERIFPIHAKTVEKVEIVRSHHVRRAKLYFMRERKGKAARLRERRRA
jgi:large subunit ribosomal protein L19